jgi:hypothetical protein
VTPHAQAKAPGATIVALALRALVILNTVSLLFVSAVHLFGVQIQLGFGVFTEPPILAAGIVEGLCGVVFAVALFAILTRQTWQWGMTLAANIVGALGYILGLISTRDGTTPFNYADHRVMLALFAIGLILLALPVGREALASGERAPRNVPSPVTHP